MAVRISWNSCVRSTAMSGPPDVLIEEINRILLYALLSSIKNECISIEHWIDLPKVSSRISETSIFMDLFFEVLVMDTSS